MIADYVSGILNQDLNEESVRMSNNSNSIANSNQTCNPPNEAHLSRDHILQSPEISEKAKELLKDENNFIANQVQSYFRTFDMMRNKGQRKSEFHQIVSKAEPIAIDPLNKSLEKPDLSFLSPREKSSSKNSSEKYENLSSEDRNFINRKVQEYYTVFENNQMIGGSQSSTSERVKNLNNSDWMFVKSAVQDYLTMSISDFTKVKISSAESVQDQSSQENLEKIIVKDDKHGEIHLTVEQTKQIKEYVAEILSQAELRVMDSLQNEKHSKSEEENSNEIPNKQNEDNNPDFIKDVSKKIYKIF